MANAHSVINSLIALATLNKYQEGGEVVQPTMGQRLIQRFPSQHRDAMRAAEQERALAGFIDLVVPQSIGEAGLMLAAGPVAGKAAKIKALAALKEGFKDMGKFKKIFNKGDEYRLTFTDDRPNIRAEWTGGGWKTYKGDTVTTNIISPALIKKVDKIKTISVDDQARALGRFEEFSKYGSLETGGKRLRPKNKYKTVYEKPK